MAFRLKSRAGINDLIERLQGKKSTQYVLGSLCKMTDGVPVVIAGATEQPFLLVENMDIQPYNGQSLGNVNGLNLSPLRPVTELLTTTKGEQITGIPIHDMQDIETDLAPLLGGATIGATAVVNTNKAAAVAAYGGSTGDFTGGTVYLPEQDWQGIVETSVVGAGNVTLVFNPPAPRACTTGDTIQALPFGPGDKVKWDATTPELLISSAAADVTGGLFQVHQIDMSQGKPKGTSALVSGRITSPI